MNTKKLKYINRSKKRFLDKVTIYNIDFYMARPPARSKP